MNREIEKILRQHLQRNYANPLTKFSYLNTGAEQFIQLTANSEYVSYEKELALINQILPTIKNLIGRKVQILDLGVGDGRKLNLILSNLRNHAEISYLGLDLSPTMIEIARKNNGFGNHYSICDFTDENQLLNEFKKLNDDANLIFMLGNTITNEVDIKSYLRQLRSITRKRTHLVIGLELFQNNIDEIEREYKTEENYELTFKPLDIIGIKKNQGQINIAFNTEKQRIEEWFIFNRRGQVRNIYYEAGDRVLLSVTYKPKITKFREIIRRSGWKEEAIVSKEGYVLCLLSS